MWNGKERKRMSGMEWTQWNGNDSGEWNGMRLKWRRVEWIQKAEWNRIEMDSIRKES